MLNLMGVRVFRLVVILLVSFIFIGGCTQKTDNSNAQLPNPASVYCEEQGGRLETRTSSDGSQLGYCIFSDGQECEEWAFYRKECEKTGENIGITGYVVKDTREEINDKPEEELIPNKIESGYILDEGETHLQNHYVEYGMLRENSDDDFIRIHYVVDADDPVDFIVSPHILDLEQYAKLSGRYNWYGGCIGHGKHIEGECVVDNFGYAIWNTNPFWVNVNYKFEVIE